MAKRKIRRTRAPTTPPTDPQPTQEELIDKLMARFDEINAFYIEKVAETIRRIGELRPVDMHRIEVWATVNADIAEINRRIAEAAKIARAELYKIYNKALNDLYHSPRFERAMNETPLPDIDKQRLNNLAQMIARQTADTMENLSNTTAVSETYRRTVDKAILANVSGLDSYDGAMRKAIHDLGYNGLQVTYESGYHRRLDTALRQNIIDGSKQIAQQGAAMMGEALGYNAVELSAHLASAPDHEPVQGRVFLLEQFDRMQSEQDFVDIDGNHYSGFRRPIGEWNCMHIPQPFDTRYSRRIYSNEQLQKWAANNQNGCTINGKHYTLYQASQLMRKIETEVRREKDAANAARAAGDEELRRKCQERIDRLGERYTDVANASGFRPQRNRMAVEGFKPLKL